MKIISKPEPTWEKQLTCDRCGTVFEADESDLDYEKWKTSGYWFNDSAVTEMRFSVQCPTCPDSWTKIDDDEIHVLIKDKLREAYRQKKRRY